MKTEVRDFECVVCKKKSRQSFLHITKPADSTSIEDKVKFLDKATSSIHLQKCANCGYINIDIEKPIVPNISDIVLTPEYANSIEEDIDSDTYYYDYLVKTLPAIPETYAILAYQALLYKQAALSLYFATDCLEKSIENFKKDLEGEKLDITDKEFIASLKFRIKKDLEKAQELVEKHISDYPEDYIAKCISIRIYLKNSVKNSGKIQNLVNSIRNDECIPQEVKTFINKLILD
ncbi:MAG: hypothetical protein PHO33_03505 [Clostridia bacterium]|nr:hypothetical protein [Clostridia bacterium]